MTDFNVEDIVKYRNGNEHSYGSVLSVNKTDLCVLDLNSYEQVTVAKCDAVFLPKIFLDEETYSKLARYEITLQDVVKDNVPENIVCRDDFTITLQDVACVLKKVISENIDNETFYDEWLSFFREIMRNTYYEDQDCTFYNKNHVMRNVTEGLRFWSEYSVEIDSESLLNEINTFLEDENKPLKERRFPISAKRELLQTVENNQDLNTLAEDELTLYRQFAKELCEQGDPEGLEAVGYGCYGGNRAFECDWKKSEECMLKLVDSVDCMPEQALYANTLGYIYYYGRTTDGVPDYEKAYKYFSFAAFNGVYEAKYKIADMYKNGYGVPKSIETAENIIYELYDENFKYIQKGEFNTKFADIAFRLGNLQKNETDIYKSNLDAMLYYYTQAKFAIKMRMKANVRYGDKSVLESIEKALSETKKICNYKPQETTMWGSVGSLISYQLNAIGKFDVETSQIKDGRVKLTFTPHKRYDQTYSGRLFLTIPELDMCGLYDSFTVIANPFEDGCVCFSDETTNTFVIDEADSDCFYYDGLPVIEFCDCLFEIEKPKENEKAYRFISVCFETGGKHYDYICDDESIKIGDTVKVIAKGEEKEVTVVNVFYKTERETKLPIGEYKRV